MMLATVPAMAETTSGPAARPAVAMMMRMIRASLLVAHACWVIAFALSWWLSGVVGVVNAAVGGGLVIAFYAAGQGIQMLASEMEAQAAMGLTVTSFMTRAALLGLLLLAANRHPAIEDIFRPVEFFTAVMLVLAGWLGGMFLAWRNTRVPVYDQHWDPRPRPRAHRRSRT